MQAGSNNTATYVQHCKTMTTHVYTCQKMPAVASISQAQGLPSKTNRYIPWTSHISRMAQEQRLPCKHSRYITGTSHML